jgi:uncharacterized spore protein YtfJ
MDAGNILDKVASNLSVGRAFGAAYEKDGALIIPVALVAGGGGGGTAAPRRGNPAPLAADPAPLAADPGPPAVPAGSDGGGGFGGLVLPSGVYVIKGDQVRWVPAVDTTIVVLASLGLVRLLTRAWTRRSKGSKG